MTTKSVNDNGSHIEEVVTTNAKVMVNGDILFSFNGDIQIVSLFSECITANDATASTLQYRITTTTPASNTTISGASSSLANATAGTIVILDGTALSTAPVVAPAGVTLATTARGITTLSGNINVVIGVGSTTGTWRHYLRYKALEHGTTVVNYQ